MSPTLPTTRTRTAAPARRRPDAGRGPVVYLAATLPGRSQTFVYQELHAVRARGMAVAPVSVRRNLLMARVEAELGPVHALLGPGFARAAAAAVARRPAAALGALLRVARAPYPGRADRVRCVWHGVIGLALADHVHRIGARYVHAHHANLATTAAMVASAAAGVPFGFTAHGSDVHVKPLLMPEKVGAAALVVAASDHVRATLRDLAGGGEVEVVRCGVPLDRFRLRAPRAPGASLRLLHVGRLIEAKDQLTLVRAMAGLRERGVAAELRLVGEGPERAALEAEIARLGVAGVVRLFGAVPNEELPPLYAWADAFVMSSRREGLPVVLAEAMAAELPVVSTGVSGIPELVRDGREGLLVPPEDPDALAGALARLTDAELRRSMGRSGAERSRVHDIDAVARRLVGLFGGDPPPAGATDPAVPVSVALLAGAADDAGLGRALAALRAQRPAPPAEVLVVSPRADAALRRRASEAGARVVVADGVAAAAREASHEWVLALDARELPLPHAVAALVNARDGAPAVAAPAVVVGHGAVRAVTRAGEDPSGVLARRAWWTGPQRAPGRALRAPAVSVRTVEETPPAPPLARLRARRRAGRLAADGVAAVAVMPSAAHLRALVDAHVPERPLRDLTGRTSAAAWVAVALAPPAAAFVGRTGDALLARLLGVRPLWPDRPESQTRGSRGFRGPA